MKKIKSALFMVALCATLAMLTSCGNNKKTKYTYAPLWDNTISEKDTTGIVGHIFKGTNEKRTEYIYFSETGYYYNLFYDNDEQDNDEQYSEKEMESQLQKIVELDKDFQKDFSKKYGKNTDTDNETELMIYLTLSKFENSMDNLDFSDNLIMEEYAIDIDEDSNCIINRRYFIRYYFEIEKNEPVVIEEHRSNKSIYYLYK